ncbi:hypothetical protein C8R46DRAFT_1027198 [Mycena filopes]|nr:hypothetical protein C8R46DRAFT_1027198 [Mycena filopes]
MDSIPCAAHKAYLVPQILLGHSENFNPLRRFPEILFTARRLVHGPFKIFFRCAALMLVWKVLFRHIRNPDYWGFSAATSEIFFRCAALIILHFFLRCAAVGPPQSINIPSTHSAR